MPLKPRHLIEESEQQLAAFEAGSLEAIYAMRDFVATSHAMEAASRKLILQSRRLLNETAGIAAGYKATVYSPRDVPPVAAE